MRSQGEEQQQQQEQNSGIKTGPKLQKLVENYCFSRVSKGTLGSFGARFWRCSVLQGHCVSPCGRVRLQPREAEQEQQREQCTNSGTKTGRKLLFFEAVRLDFGAVPSFRATAFPCPAGCVFSLGRKSSSSNGSSRRVLSLIVQTMVQKLVKNYCFFRVSEGTLGTFQVRSGAVPSFRATVFPCPAGCVRSLGGKSSSSNRSRTVV